MPLLTLIIGLAVLGLCLYLLEHYVPMDPIILLAIRVIVALTVIVYLLRLFGIADVIVGRR